MYLKRLELLGFKSFANKTQIKFAPGVTAIVGPNGCGKTNVLDALRWVMGEQRVSLLRGGKMEEVIFNGTRDIKALNMSEVVLTIVNNRGVLPTEYSELQIARRLFRSGESEYLLNKVPCRLKDITELFLDTGMGAHSYSVIQQDMIDAVLSDKAEERRFLFEEAAGITKYKQRKKAALRKLEATEQDFLRLKDIYAEVKTQVNSLYRQHKKAERYQRVVDDIKGWEIYLSATRLQALNQERRELKAELDKLNDSLQQKNAGLDRVSADHEVERNRQHEIERRLSDLNNRAYEISEKAHGLEREISINREKRAYASNLIEKNLVDISALEQRLVGLEAQRTGAEAELAERRAELDKIADELSAAEAVQAEADRRLLQARAGREEKNRRLLELEGKLSSGKAEGDSLRQQQEELEQQLAAVEKRLTEARPKQTDLLRDLEARREHLNRLNERKSAMERQQRELKAQTERLVDEVEQAGLDVSNLTASLEACEARRTLLEEMIAHYEGFDAGLVAALQEKDRWPGIAGTVAERFVPVDGLEVALEAALGDLAGCLICRDRATAEQIIKFVRKQNKGRLGILVPTSGALSPGIKRPEITAPGFVGWLDRYVSTGDDLKVLKEAVLSRIAVFDAGQDPSALLQQLPYGFSAVSTDGTLYGANLISGGSQDELPLFRRKEKVEEQAKQIAELSQRLNVARGEKNQATLRLAHTRSEINRLADELDSLNEEIGEAAGVVSELDFERRTLAGEFERLDRDRRSYSGKLEQIRDRQYSLGLDHNQLSTQRDDLVSTMTEAGSTLEDFEIQATEALERVSGVHVRQIEARGRVEQVESRLSHTGELEDNITGSLKQKKEEIEVARSEITDAESRIERFEVELKAAFEQRESLSAEQGECRESQSQAMEVLSEKERALKALRTEKDSLSEEIHQREIRMNTITSETGGLVERIRDEHDVDISSLTPERPSDEMSDQEARTHLTEQKEKLKKFGAVNLLALEEYKTASERERFLSEQLEDLTAAKNDLQSTISRINTTARQLFGETFERARENFKVLFDELFTGGEADIRLEDPDDPLDSNIEIMARPRGKKILSISMMSGGERALTAIALLFSLYLVKPSPFCILDEIDAPLDDANCRRFLRILRKFSEQTQFITITHNKITMQAADNLYGVTMEEPGVSKLVSVRFSDGDGEEVSVDTTAAGEESETSVQTTPLSELPEEIARRINPEIHITDDQDN